MSKEKRRYASARERANKVKQGFTANILKVPDGVQMFQPKAGRYLLDILPYVAGDGNKHAEEGEVYYERTFYTHRGIGANQETFICPRMTAKEPCPVCEYRAKLMKDQEENEDLIKDLAPKERQVFNVINLKEPDKGPQLFEFSYHNFGKMLDKRLRSADEEDEWDFFFDYGEKGRTLKVSFADESLGGYSFVQAESIDFKERSKEYEEDILDDTLCLDEILIIPDYDDLKKALLETEKEEEDEHPSHKRDEEQEEEERPRAGKRPRPGREEEGEEETPRRRSRDPEEELEENEPRRGKAPKDKDKDWDEFEKEKDGEEEETPRRRKPKDEEQEEEERPRRGKREEQEEEETPRRRR